MNREDNISRILYTELQKLPLLRASIENNISVEDITLKTDRFYILKPFDKISEYFSEVNVKLFNLLHKNKFDQLDEIKRINRESKKLIANNSYIEVKDLEVPVLMGLDIDLYRALEYIERESTVIDQNLYNLVRDTSSLLDRVLTDDEYIRSFTIDNDPHPDIDKQIKNIEKTIHTIVNRNSLVDRVPIGRLMGNLNVLSNITDKSIRIGKNLNPSNLSTLEKYVEELSKKTKLFEEKILNSNREIHRDKIKLVATMLEDTARYITVTTMLTLTFIRILNTVEHIARVLDDSKLRKLGLGR